VTTTQPAGPVKTTGEQSVRADELTDEESVLADIAAMLVSLLEEYGLEDIEIDMDTTFNQDLELESIDLVALAGHLEARYGQQVNFAEFIAEMELDEIIGLTVGRLVEYVVQRLNVQRLNAQRLNAQRLNAQRLDVQPLDGQHPDLDEQRLNTAAAEVS
jgi:acyl carrier protein